MEIIEVTPENIMQEDLFCVKDFKSNGFHNKRAWYEKRYAEGLRVNIMKNDVGKAIGYVEYVPARAAWRPILAPSYLFIQCLYIYSKKDRNKGYGAILIDYCEQKAREAKLDGLCTMTSKGAWVANHQLFEKNDFHKTDERGRFELRAKKWTSFAPDPYLNNWEAKQHDYPGWHIVYADQCPWHEKSVEAMLKVALDHDIDIQVRKLESPEEAMLAPSGFGVFSLLHEGRLLEDHYLSETRFRNILKKELAARHK